MPSLNRLAGLAPRISILVSERLARHTVEIVVPSFTVAPIAPPARASRRSFMMNSIPLSDRRLCGRPLGVHKAMRPSQRLERSASRGRERSTSRYGER
jgi:hypothetical protein